MKVHDLIAEQDDRKAHVTPFTLWPKTWQAYNSTLCAGWKFYPLTKANKPSIPSKPGIYTFLVQPGIAQHPAASFLMYVGQAKDLAKRFGDYLSAERKPGGRPRVIRLLHKYENYLLFCYCEVPKQDLDVAENSLISAMDPPCNDRVDATLSATKKAF